MGYTDDMTLSEELTWRGFVNQTTLADLKKLDTDAKRFYMGFDASAPSQTVGNLAAMMFAKTFLRHGWQGVLLAGGATSLIGDPGGKDTERVLQNEKAIARNVVNASNQIKSILSGQRFKLVNNLDWTKDLKVIPFLRDIGKHFSMTPLIQRDYIAKRLGEGGAGISYAEFSYTILQGMDYLHLYDREGVTLQLGGSDQWGNCLSGVELVRRARGAEVDAITLNLVINKATGKKFGKSEDGAVWLDENLTSVYRFYQFWLNADDEGVEGYLKVFTELDKPAIDHLMDSFRQNRAERLAQRTLAEEVTRLVHGQERAQAVKNASDVLFGQGSFLDLNKKEKQLLKDELPRTKAIGALSDVLVSTGLAASKTEARNFISAGAVSVNGDKITAEESVQLVRGDNLLKRGKNSFAIVES